MWQRVKAILKQKWVKNEQFEQNSVKNQVYNSQTTTLLTNMMLYNMKAQYNIKDTVPIFNPNPIEEKE